MSTFQSVLKNLVERVEGSRWAIIVGVDGVLLEADTQVFRSEGEVIAAEFATLFRSCRNLTAGTDMGELLSSVLVTDRGKIVLQYITSDYFLLMFLESDAHAGKAFFEIYRSREPLTHELVY